MNLCRSACGGSWGHVSGRGGGHPPRARVRQRASSSRVSAVMRAGCAAAALFAAFATGCGGHGRAPGTIVFESDRSGRAAVYAVREDGSGLKKLLDLPEEAEVIWTRDGTKALVLAYPSFVFTPASRARRIIRLPGLASDNVPSWSPDNKRLVFATGHGDVVALDGTSGVRHRLAEGSNGFG